MHVSNSMKGGSEDGLVAKQRQLKEYCNRELLLWHLSGDRLKPTEEAVCRNLLDWLVFEVECEVQAREMFGERVLVDPSWGQDLSEEIIEYLTSPKNPSVDCRMAAPKKIYKRLPRLVGRTAVSLVKQEVKDFILTSEAYGEKSHDESEIRGHLKLVFQNDFTHQNTLLNLIIEEAVRELNDEESKAAGENQKPRSIRPPNAPPKSPPLVRIGIIDPAADTARGRRVVQALKEIFAEGQEFTDVQVMTKLQEKLDISEFLYQMKKLDYSMTDLIAFHRREALQDVKRQVEKLQKGEKFLPALVSEDDITDLMLTRDEESQCEELMKLVSLFPEDSLEKECGVSRIEIADVMIELYNKREYATESIFIKAVITHLFDNQLKDKVMDPVTAKCFPRFLLKAWRLTQERLGDQLKIRGKAFGTSARVRIKKEPEEEQEWGEDVIVIDLTDSTKKRRRDSAATSTSPAPEEENPGVIEEGGVVEADDWEESQDSLDLIQDPEDETQLSREQKRVLEENVRNAMLGTAYLSLTLEELLGQLPQVTEGGLEGTGIDYSRAAGQVAKMMLRVRKQRVKEEQERMKREFEEQGSQQLFRRPLRPTPKKSRPERSTRDPERSTQVPERSVSVPERSTGQEGDEGSRVLETPQGPPEVSEKRSGRPQPPEQEMEEDEETELSSFVGDEPPLLQSSGREEDLKIPKATKTTRRRLFQREEITPIEAFKKIAKTLQVTIFEGTRASKEHLVQQAWRRLEDMSPRMEGLPEDRKENHREKLRKLIDCTIQAVEGKLNRRLPAGVDENSIRLCIRNMLQGEDFLDLTLGMILFELEDVFKVDLIGGVGLIKDVLTDERNLRAATGAIRGEEEIGDEEIDEVEVGNEDQQMIDWQAIETRTLDLLRAGNNRNTMTEPEIVTSVANFCKVPEDELKNQILRFRKVVNRCKGKLGVKPDGKLKLVKPPPKRQPKPRNRSWRDGAQRLNDSFRINRRTRKKQPQDQKLKSALARELAKQAAEATFLDRPVQPCIGAMEFIREAKAVTKDLWDNELRAENKEKPKFNSVALAALQEAYEDYGNRLFSYVQIAANHRRTPAEIRNRAMKTITKRDLELVKELRSDSRGNILP